MAGSRRRGERTRSGKLLRRRQARPEQPRPTGTMAPEDLQLEVVFPAGYALGPIAIAGHRVMVTGTATFVSTNGRNFYPRTHPGSAYSLLEHAGAFYSCCQPNKLVRSTDFGTTWKPIDLPSDARDPAILYRDAQEVWWLSSRSGPMLTANKPTVGWRAAGITDDPINACAERGTRLFYVGDRSGVWNGSIARPITVPAVRRLAVFRDGTMLALGPTGAYRSNDRGRTFTAVVLDPPRGFSDFAWVAGALVALSETSVVRWTGDNFERIATPLRMRLHAIASWGDGALICGEGGTILRLASPADPYWDTSTDELAPTRAGIEPHKPQPTPLEARERARAELEREAVRMHAELAAPLIAARPTDPNARLAQLVEEAPDDDRVALQVYADWLHVEDDPRAELAAVQLHLEQEYSPELAAVAQGLLREHADALLGRAAPIAEELRLVWCGGFLQGIHIAPSERCTVERVLPELLDHPSSRFLRSLQIEMPADFAPALRAIEGRYLPALRRLIVGMFERTSLERTRVDLEPVYAALPQLRTLVVRARSVHFGTIVLPQLERMWLHCDGLVERAARSLATAHWPNLRFLEIEVGARRTGGTAKLKDFRPLFDAAAVPALTELGLKYIELSDELIDRLAGSRLLAQLEDLDLAHGTLSAAGARVLYTRQRMFAHLRRLSLNDNLLDAGARALLESTGLPIVFGTQRPVPDDGRLVLP